MAWPLARMELRRLSGGCDNEVVLWQVSTGEEIQRFSEPTGLYIYTGFQPDGKMAITGSDAFDDIYSPGEWILWDLESGELSRRFEGGHSYGPTLGAISPDGRTLISAEYNLWSEGGDEPGSPLILWDLESGEIIHRFPTSFTPYGWSGIPSRWQKAPSPRLTTRSTNGI